MASLILRSSFRLAVKTFCVIWVLLGWVWFFLDLLADINYESYRFQEKLLVPTATEKVHRQLDRLEASLKRK